MRFIFVPEKLMPIHLLDYLGDAPGLDEIFQRVNRRFQQGRQEEALNLIDSTISSNLATKSRYVAALLLLYKAHLHYQRQHWEDALDCTQRALKWLHLEVTQVARYNRAIAHYWEGLIHYLLHCNTKAIQAFDNAAKLLEESERFWGFEDRLTRVEDCQNLLRWMRNLLDLHHRLPPNELVFIVSLYELDNLTPVRIGAVSLSPFQVMMPGDVIGKYLGAGYIPLDIDYVSFLYLRPEAYYIAVKILEDGVLVPPSRADDILLIEVVPPATSSPAELLLGANTTFVRRTDGRIYFHRQQTIVEDIVGIPRMLIREVDEAWVMVSTNITYS